MKTERLHESRRGKAARGTREMGEMGEKRGYGLAAGGVEAQRSERARETGQMTAPLGGSVMHSLLSSLFLIS